MRLDLELRRFYSVVVLAEEMHFTRASHRLRIARPGLSRRIQRIQRIERLHRVRLFARDKGRIVELTDPGRVFFVDEARLAIFRAERALNPARRSSCPRACNWLLARCGTFQWIGSLLSSQIPAFRLGAATGTSSIVLRSECGMGYLAKSCRTHLPKVLCTREIL